MTAVHLAAAQSFAREANRLRDSAALEEPLKLNLFHHLPQIFIEQPTWMSHHVSGAESLLRIATESGTAGRFADSLVGQTSIEYESDLRRTARWRTGYRQVQEHCAGLLNGGASLNAVIGVLSDTVDWYAFDVELAEGAEIGRLAPEDIVLQQLAGVQVSDDSEDTAKDFVRFLEQYLGRRGSRPLNPATVSQDFGFDGLVGHGHVGRVAAVVATAFVSRPDYAALIEQLWVRFVAVAGSGSAIVEFDRTDYANELYLVTLAKLICADVLAGDAIRSSASELRTILSGEHFQALGLDNVVEYDYFGWLGEPPHVDVLVPIAKAIQEDLQAYDFSALPAEDLFGQLMAVLGERSHRLLLGQEFTPAWLSAQMADELLAKVPPDTPLRAIDMCCGSGAMLVAVSNAYRERLIASGHACGDAAALRLLIDAATGFDIDPLAVLLAKVNWLIANRDWLVPGERVSIPVYLADSLFVGVPFADDGSGTDRFRLTLYGDIGLDLPGFLIRPECRQLFDDLLHRAYFLARVVDGEPVEQDAIDAAVAAAVQAFPNLSDEQASELLSFFSDLVASLVDLQEAGLNGLWAFVLRNSYRPSLVAGQFNALISNPPWLALSKIAANPYGESLRALARQLALSPPGAAHLHTELATIFLYAAVDRFLADDSAIVCILPHPVLNGFQHTPFRTGAPLTSAKRVPLAVEALWRVEHGTFKNEAVVLSGQKRRASPTGTIPGKRVSSIGSEANPFTVVTRGNRTVWSDLPAGSNPTGFFDAGEFRQGADLMPRTVMFHGLQRTNQGRWSVSPIDRQTSPLRYLVKDAKRLKQFSIASGSIDDRYVIRVQMSNHLTPFDIAEPALAVLPVVRVQDAWEAVSLQVLATDRASAQVVQAMLGAVELLTPADLVAAVETDRRKLSAQSFTPGAFLVVYGAGGGVPCAAYRQLVDADADRLAVDQTLYWHVVPTQDEALYLVGMFNSPAIGPVIAAFQPQGQQGERHIHRLPALVTQRFDPSDPDHQAVVDATRILQLQAGALVANDPGLREKLDPNRALASRRTALRRAFERLESFAAYEQAARRVYVSSTS